MAAHMRASSAVASKGTDRMNPAFAWLFVFLPALGYFLSTRLSGIWSELGEEATAHLLLRLGDESHNACTKLVETFHLLSPCLERPDPVPEPSTESSSPSPQTSVELKYPLRLVQDSGLSGVVNILWRHDSQLGRGYLLLSESARQGRIWRWEVGGGPIAIGKTLHVDQAGCRSGLYKNCSSSSTTATNQNLLDGMTNSDLMGSGALAIDFYRDGNPSTHSSEGRLLVAEWGEGRIVRLEESGARTPLVLHVPSTCAPVCTVPSDGAVPVHGECSKRLPNIEQMLVTPTGDLIIAANYNDSTVPQCDEGAVKDTVSPFSASLSLISKVVHVKPIATLHESRQAHSWTEVQHNFTTSRDLFSDPTVLRIGGIAMSTTYSSVFLTALHLQPGNDHTSIVVLELPLVQENDEDDEDEVSDSTHQSRGPVQAKLLVDLAMYTAGSQKPGALVVAQSGRIFVTVHDGVVLVDPQLGVLGKVVVPNEPTAISLGGDGYLYVASHKQLYRIRTKEQCATSKTTLVPAPRN